MPDNSTGESKRVLDPVERISEILFGLIIVLTFTCSLSVRHADRGKVDAMLLGAVGCSLAWGIIDAAFYLLACYSERGHNLVLLQRVRTATDPDEAKRTIAEALPPLVASHLRAEEFESLRREFTQLPEPRTWARITKDDWRGALGVFLLGFGSILPVVIPFTFMSDARVALRISNGIAILLLFLTGYALGRYASDHPWRYGFAMVILGTGMVGITIALGG